MASPFGFRRVLEEEADPDLCFVGLGVDVEGFGSETGAGIEDSEEELVLAFSNVAELEVEGRAVYFLVGLCIGVA